MGNGSRQLRSSGGRLEAAFEDQGREGPGTNWTKKWQDIGETPMVYTRRSQVIEFDFSRDSADIISCSRMSDIGYVQSKTSLYAI